ncbi:MAG: hypothetical protein WCY82_02480 [Desulfotomaculaceae bacterium]
MYKKSCPYCKGDSFSAVSQGKWECPYCNADLTIFMPESAATLAHGQSAGSAVYLGSSSARDKISERIQSGLVLLSGGKKGGQPKKDRNCGNQNRKIDS